MTHAQRLDAALDSIRAGSLAGYSVLLALFEVAAGLIE